MIFEKFIDTGLGHVSYIVACELTGEACIVDPERDIGRYSEFMGINALTLKYIFSTHPHADYIGGHIELATTYNAPNIFSHLVPIENFETIQVKENDRFFIGNSIKIAVVETPGHTPFDICLLVSEGGADKLIFTGDILFIGDMGRADLLGEGNMQTLADASYDSAKKIWNLADEIIVLPSHVRGSLCGKNLSHQYFSTIGIEKKTNRSFALCQQSKEQYVQNLLSQNIDTPIFFKKMPSTNIAGPKLIKDIKCCIKEIEFDEIEIGEDIQIIDMRHPNLFHKNHIKGSVNIYEFSNVSFIAGSILSYEKDIYLVGSVDMYCEDFITKLLRVGLDNIKGVIKTDFKSIESIRLESSNILQKEEITKEFVNILLDKNCSNLGTVIEISISRLFELNLSKYEKIFFSCKYGFKSSAITSMISNANIFWVEQ